MNELCFALRNYGSLTSDELMQLYKLRCNVFKTRLNWEVNVTAGMEFDSYDNENTDYLIITKNNVMLAGVRLINTTLDHMNKGAFKAFFTAETPVSPQLYESSRFFIEKDISRSTDAYHVPLTALLLLFMHEYCHLRQATGIVTVVSKAMARVVKTNGWAYNVVEIGEANPGESAYLLHLPISESNKNALRKTILRHEKSEYYLHLLNHGLERNILDSRLSA
jgi:acyl homoserine lactone synthase